MKVIEAGHVYEVEHVDGDKTQAITFVRRRGADGELLLPEDRHEGILAQELLRVLIDRVLYLYAERPCDEDTRIVEHLRSALVQFEARASRRTIEKLAMPEKAEPCPYCHHLLCAHMEHRL